MEGIFRMKGIVLAGGLGTRLKPLTDHDNKHFLPVGLKRMIEYPIASLVEAGIKDIILVVGGKNPGAFLELLKNGNSYGIEKLYYTYQEGNGGIAEALSLAEPFMSWCEPCAVILGDNYFNGSLKPFVSSFNRGCKILLTSTDTPERFGIATFNDYGEVASIKEKPKSPGSNLAITGCYLFDTNVWEYAKCLSPSARGELEITDILNTYLSKGMLSYNFYNETWSDLGTPKTLQYVSQLVLNA
jgi:glucose-1-phosphate thymidylyltransferase